MIYKLILAILIILLPTVTEAGFRSDTAQIRVNATIISSVQVEVEKTSAWWSAFGVSRDDVNVIATFQGVEYNLSNIVEPYEIAYFPIEIKEAPKAQYAEMRRLK